MICNKDNSTDAIKVDNDHKSKYLFRKIWPDFGVESFICLRAFISFTKMVILMNA